MSTSQTTGLSEPTGSTKIPLGTLGYVCARNRQRAYDLVIREFKKSGLTQAQLAKRLGKAAEVISRLLSRPRNWELDTFSELLFAISGTVPAYNLTHPLSGQKEVKAQKLKPENPVTKTEPPPGQALNLKVSDGDVCIESARVEFARAA